MDENQTIEKSEDPNDSEKSSTRRSFIVKAATAAAGVGAAVCTIPFIRSMWPDAGVIAAGTTEVDVSNLKVGDTMTVMWQGKPVFITHRTPEQIKEAQAIDINTLRDPQLDSERVLQGKEQWLVTIAVCTHLGCVPTVGKGEFGGSLCPCHGSQYDTSQRIRQGPAPKNLAVPPYAFISDTKIKIG
jgi:ubiquinol-cytochrome c reductase iron-sulfur subunit